MYRFSLGHCDQIFGSKPSVLSHMRGMELALALYGRGILTMGKARRLAGISKREFLEELGTRKIERHYTIEELEEDLAFAKGECPKDL